MYGGVNPRMEIQIFSESVLQCLTPGFHHVLLASTLSTKVRAASIVGHGPAPELIKGMRLFQFICSRLELSLAWMSITPHCMHFAMCLHIYKCPGVWTVYHGLAILMGRKALQALYVACGYRSGCPEPLILNWTGTAFCG